MGLFVRIEIGVGFLRLRRLECLLSKCGKTSLLQVGDRGLAGFHLRASRALRPVIAWRNLQP